MKINFFHNNEFRDWLDDISDIILISLMETIQVFFFILLSVRLGWIKLNPNLFKLLLLDRIEIYLN